MGIILKNNVVKIQMSIHDKKCAPKLDNFVIFDNFYTRPGYWPGSIKCAKVGQIWVIF